MPLQSFVRTRTGALLLGIRIAAAAVVHRARLQAVLSTDGIQPCTPADFGAKDLDLVVYGATGFTGRLAAEYLAAWAPDALRWAIAGRSAKKLEELTRDLTLGTAGAPSILVADLADAPALLNMTRRARAVVSYAGPYEAYGGEALIREALQGCAHYVDLTGEAPWKKAMLDRYAQAAAARGVALVQSAGVDSLAPDVLALAAAEAVAEDDGGPPDEVKVLCTELNGWFSGGTMASGSYSAAHHSAIMDPYAFAPEAPPSARVDTMLSGMESYGVDTDFETTVKSFVFADSDCPVIRRSLCLRFPGAPVSVSEAESAAVKGKMVAYLTDPRMLTHPAPLHPQPGQGPPEWMMKKGSFSFEVLARRKSDERVVRMNLHAKGDPGYAATAKMSAELGLGLALNGTAGGKGGYLTPATALDPGVLKHRLEQADGGKFMTFSP